jgi:hypothetical protein
MIADAAALKAAGKDYSSSPSPSKSKTGPPPTLTLSIETAMMIESANTKRLNVKACLSTGSGEDIIPMDEFTEAITKLASTIGDGEDEETKSDLAKAISPEAITAIMSLCGDPRGITLSKFLELCEAEVDKYMASLADGEEEVEEDVIPPAPLDASSLSPPKKVKDANDESKFIPRSPFDEEVAFNLEEEEETETVFDNKRSPVIEGALRLANQSNNQWIIFLCCVLNFMY